MNRIINSRNMRRLSSALRPTAKFPTAFRGLSHRFMSATSMTFETEATSSESAKVVVKEEIEDDSVQLSGSGVLPVTTELNIVDTQELDKWPVFRMLGKSGTMMEGVEAPAHLEKDEIISMYRMMIRIQALDDIFYNAQRQGRISFYMQNAGEEAIQIGSASALSSDDLVFAQYRESGVLLYRGFSLQQAADQCFSNEMDLGKGRQMPVHYGSSELNYQTVSSPLTTQLPQAAGAAYAMKLR